MSVINKESEMKVEVVATSSVVPVIELQRGLNKLSELGFSYHCAANLLDQDFIYAGSQEVRAQAFYAAAQSDAEIVWAVRGGYGAGQLLEILSYLENKKMPIKNKLLIGYSDVTALFGFVTQKWGWRVLHASMLASADFHNITAVDESALLGLIKRKYAQPRWHQQPLTWVCSQNLQFEHPIIAPLFGGNLAVICSLIGTPWQLDFSHKILFLEEIGESWSKIERMLQQLLFSGALNECKAIVLGEFIHCKDTAPSGLVSEDSEKREPIRVPLSSQQALEQVFSKLAQRLAIPIAAGMPVGHCQQNAPL
ncbi:MAG: muramoyltetrapeptide carboxypeptidase, partial [Oceanospirillaceae bacterium]